MIVAPADSHEWSVMANFLHDHAHVQFSPDLKMIGWMSAGELQMVVGFNLWLGSTCQGHVACLPHFRFCPRSMIEAAFRYVFDTAKREMVIVVVNSKNHRAMKMDQQLGFREFSRLPEMHEDGGDLVLMGMTREQCRFLDSGGKWQRTPLRLVKEA
jgi:L-amino acid N-acyltransferase YncA